jgi:hypothetical protein
VENKIKESEERKDWKILNAAVEQQWKQYGTSWWFALNGET